MDETEFIAICREAVWVMIKVGAPMMLIALFIGVCIFLIQALTQIEETTLTFVPKILFMMLGMVIFLPFMLGSLASFTNEIFARIISGN